MNRKHFFKTLLAGIGVGVAARKAKMPGAELKSSRLAVGCSDLSTKPLNLRASRIGFDEWNITVDGDADEGQIFYANDQNGTPFDFIYRNGECIRWFGRGGIVNA